MILKNNLYKVISADNDSRSFLLELIGDSTIYRAHFPGHPITPGVCIIQMAAELLSSLLGENLILSSVTNAKFLNVIDPCITKSLYFSFDKIAPAEDDSQIKAQIRVHNNDIVFSKLSLSFLKSSPRWP